MLVRRVNCWATEKDDGGGGGNGWPRRRGLIPQESKRLAGGGGRAASTRGGRAQIFRGVSLRFRYDRICPHDLHRFRPYHQIRNGKLIWSCLVSITIVYGANAAPNEIGIWFLLSARPFLALPARLRSVRRRRRSTSDQPRGQKYSNWEGKGCGSGVSVGWSK